mgnify:CR=1 FL=1
MARQRRSATPGSRPGSIGRPRRPQSVTGNAPHVDRAEHLPGRTGAQPEAWVVLGPMAGPQGAAGPERARRAVKPPRISPTHFSRRYFTNCTAPNCSNTLRRNSACRREGGGRSAGQGGIMRTRRRLHSRWCCVPPPQTACYWLVHRWRATWRMSSPELPTEPTRPGVLVLRSRPAPCHRGRPCCLHTLAIAQFC